MTLQETFDLVVNHLRNQGCKSRGTFDGEMSCAYRGDDGKKCAAGCLIPDDLYDPEFEGKRIITDPETHSFAVAADLAFRAASLKLAKVIRAQGHDLDLVNKLQTVHDNYSLDEWESGLQMTARRFQLVYTVAA